VETRYKVVLGRSDNSTNLRDSNTLNGNGTAVSANTRDTSGIVTLSDNASTQPALPTTSISTADGPTLASAFAPRRRRAIPSQYLRARENEDRQGGEVGLLPLKILPAPGKGKSDRDRLLDGEVNGLGAAQLHEELGGQLVDVSGYHETPRSQACLYTVSPKGSDSCVDVSSTETQRCPFRRLAREREVITRELARYTRT
jgi:hypothetical protein